MNHTKPGQTVRHFNFRLPSSFSAFILVLLLTLLPRVHYAQEAEFISFISDTDIGYAITCSPDGKHVYAAGIYTLVTFERQTDASLKTIDVFNNGYKGARELHDINALAVSPDGLYLYAVSSSNKTLHIFARNSITGKLTLKQRVPDDVFAGNSGAAPIGWGRTTMLISPQGKHLYWLQEINNTSKNVLAAFERNIENGEVKRIQKISNDSPQLGGFALPEQMAMSQDGVHLYLGVPHNNIIVMRRDPQTGLLSFGSHFETVQSNYQGRITVSPDDSTVVVTNIVDAKVFILKRNPAHDELEIVQTLEREVPRGLFFSADGAELYFAHWDIQEKTHYYARYTKNQETGLFTVLNEHLLKLKIGKRVIMCVSPNRDGIYIMHDDGPYFAMHCNTTTGALTIVQEFRDDVGGLDQLGSPVQVYLSPHDNGRYAYFAASGDGVLSVFERNLDTGELTFLHADSVGRTEFMIRSPDARHFYVNGARSSSDSPVSVFALDEKTNRLQHVQTYDKNEGVRWYGPMAFSPDGLYLYITSARSKQIKILQRFPKSGWLKKQPIAVMDVQNFGLGRSEGMTLSPDGRHLYYASTGIHAIGIFERDSTSGKLTFVKNQRYWRDFSKDIQISPDGKHVYLAVPGGADADNGMIDIFARNDTTGDLTYAGVFRSPDNYWYGGSNMAISADGRDVYAGLDDLREYGALAMLERSPETGLLTLRKLFTSWTDIQGLASPRQIAISQDNAFIYVLDPGYDGVATFATGRRLTTGVNAREHLTLIPQIFSLQQNYPNPFSAYTAKTNAVTNIAYNVAGSGLVPVELSIYNLQGQLVQTLVNKTQAAGNYSEPWDGRNLHGRLVSSGMYFYRLQTGSKVETKRLMVVR